MSNKLNEIQQKLKCPKNLFNQFGGYNYRSCEQILESVKELLGEATLTISDDVVLIGERYYIKATATLTDGDKSWSCSAMAREPLSKKGMDEAQITGSTSSYARKYALNGLFCIDDVKDADTTNNNDNSSTTTVKIDDTDIYLGLQAVSDLKTLNKYYNEHIGKINDKSKFNREYSLKAKELRNG